VHFTAASSVCVYFLLIRYSVPLLVSHQRNGLNMHNNTNSSDISQFWDHLGGGCNMHFYPSELLCQQGVLFTVSVGLQAIWHPGDFCFCGTHFSSPRLRISDELLEYAPLITFEVSSFINANVKPGSVPIRRNPIRRNWFWRNGKTPSNPKYVCIFFICTYFSIKMVLSNY